MSASSPPLLIRLTPPGRGAIATFRVEGDRATEYIARHVLIRSGQPLADFPPGRIVVGRFVVQASRLPQAGEAPAPQPRGEEVVVTRLSDAAVEIHCHGGLAAVARIEEILSGEGCRTIPWQEWIRQEEPDAIAAAARLALAEARTTRTAAILLDQHHGALSKAMAKIEASLQAEDADTVRRETELLLSRAPTGLHLVHPWHVVVAGRPNVGKSSLVNAIAGYRRTIVHNTPGTTRDVVSVQTAIDGWPVEISDTAGLRHTVDPIEQAGIHLACERISAADLVVLVFDRSLPWSTEDQLLVDSHPTALRVYNKSDLPSATGQRPAGFEVSATQSAGIDVLCQAIANRLVPDPPPAGSAVPFAGEQIEQLRGYMQRLRPPC